MTYYVSGVPRTGRTCVVWYCHSSMADVSYNARGRVNKTAWGRLLEMLEPRAAVMSRYTCSMSFYVFVLN